MLDEAVMDMEAPGADALRPHNGYCLDDEPHVVGARLPERATTTSDGKPQGRGSRRRGAPSSLSRHPCRD